MRQPLSFVFFFLLGCSQASPLSPAGTPPGIKPVSSTDENSWTYFLQHLPVVTGTVKDYRGRPVPGQEKQAGIIPYDVGARDLQQCADALMRLRAEYLFSQKRFGEIGFHFVSGQYYSWDSYCDGQIPVSRGNRVVFVAAKKHERTHESLRSYLDFVYTYASTLSLAKELKPAKGFGIGTVVIQPGSPGHCFIIIDEATGQQGEKLYKLAEGYTPAQSIYVLRNPEKEGVDPWHRLTGGTIETASYTFTRYQLGRFE